MASFAARVAAASAWSSFHFDDESKIGSYWPSEALPFAPAQGFIYSGDGTNNGSNIKPSIDLSEGCSSAGAMRIDVPNLTSANGGGNWTCKFKADDSIQIGPAGEYGGAVQEVYVQVRIKWNTALATFPFRQSALAGGTDGAYCNGVKLFGLHTGQPLALAGSSSHTKQVITAFNNTPPLTGVERPLMVYYYGATDGGTWNAEELPRYARQNQMPSPYCDYYSGWANCWQVPPDEYVTYTFRYKVLSRYDAAFCNFEFDLWIQQDGQARRLLHSWNDTHPGYRPSRYDTNETMSRLVLDAYLTAQDWNQVHPPGYAWFDELIIGPNDPGTADAVSYFGGGVSPSGVSPTDGGGGVVVSPSLRRSRFRRL